MTNGVVQGAVSTTVATTVAVTLPNTGGSMVITVALAVAAGMTVWGLLYARNR